VPASKTTEARPGRGPAAPAAGAPAMPLTMWLPQMLSVRARIAVGVAGLLLIVALAFPLWKITMFAGQFPEGIRMEIFAHKLVGGNGGADLQGINILNHYIGMRELAAADFPEMKFIPFALGMFLLIGLRAGVFARVSNVVDLLVLFTYFGLFSLGTFIYRMHSYGHSLSPEAAIKVPPFTPPVFGHQHIANFEVYSYPGWGTYLLGIYALVLIGILFFERRRSLRTRRVA
jgi:copper chaperone NosL